MLMITHKFREVMAFADEVTVLRRGRLAGKAASRTDAGAMAAMMIGAEELHDPAAALGARPAASGWSSTRSARSTMPARSR